MFFTHITSDTHFHHAKILRLGERPFASVHEMNEVLIANWNRVVPKDGKVLHLGDFAHDDVSVADIRAVRDRLNGEIVMALGNHDLPENLVAAGVVSLENLRLWFRSPDKDIVYSHFPLEPALLYSGRVSVHGHTHGPSSFLDAKLHAGAISVNCELTGYTPMSRETLAGHIRDVQNTVRASFQEKRGLEHGAHSG